MNDFSEKNDLLHRSRFMVSLSNHEGLARAAVRRFMVRQAHHEAM